MRAERAGSVDSALVHAVRLVGVAHVLGLGVLLGEDRDRLNAHAPAAGKRHQHRRRDQQHTEHDREHAATMI